jgi:chromosomal replication initiation ATPase DnaA
VTSSSRQLVLDLAHRAATGLEDFIVSTGNEAAVRVIDSWPHWPHPVMMLIGPQGCGKTHLASVWRRTSSATTVAAAQLADDQVPADETLIVIEDADRHIGSERALFHLMNLAREHGGNLLITGRSPPGEWEIGLPDLRSRLRACPVVRLDEPDEGLLRSVLVKLLHDRQLPATPAAVAFLSRHLDRSMASAIAVVEAIDKLLWDKPSEITREVAKRALIAIGKTGDDDP